MSDRPEKAQPSDEQESAGQLVHRYGYCSSLTWCAECDEAGEPTGGDGS